MTLLSECYLVLLGVLTLWPNLQSSYQVLSQQSPIVCLEFGTPVVKVVTTKSHSLFRGLGEDLHVNLRVTTMFSFPSFESCESFQRK